MIDPNMIALIVALLINVPTWYMLRAQKNKATNEAKSLEDEITDRVLLRARDEMTALQTRLDNERAERKADRDSFRVQIEDLRNERDLRDRIIMDMKNEITVLRRENENILEKNRIILNENEELRLMISALKNEPLR